MKRFTLNLLLVVLTALGAAAQWRAGVTAGWDYNFLSANTQYAYDLRYGGRAGLSAGLTAGYEFNSWLSAGADLLWMQRSHKMRRLYGDVDGWSWKECDQWLMLPLTVRFSFGSERLRGFTTAGMNIGWWMSRHRSGRDIALTPPETPPGATLFPGFEGSIPFAGRFDRRIEFAPVVGIGMAWRVNPGWEIGAEARCYYGLTSLTKPFGSLELNKYNTTVTLQVSAVRRFGR